MLTVNGQSVDQAHIDAEVARLKPQYNQYMQQQGQPPDEKRLHGWARESVIEQILLQQEAVKRKAPPSTDGDKPEQDVDDSKKLHQQMQHLITSITDPIPIPTEDEIAQAYDANAEHFKTPEQIHAAHIVKHTEGGASNPDAYSEMLNIRERIRKGEAFEALASEHSDCSDNAGDLGTFPREQMVQEFDDVVFALAPDEISEVFQTPFGYHIAKVFKKIEASTTPLEVVHDKLAAHLHDTRRSQAIHAFVDGLKQKATIKDDEA